MPRRRLIGAILALAVTAGSVFALLGSASGAPAMNRVSTTCAKQGYDTRYWRKQIDPIIAHLQPQSAHLHDFFGYRNPMPDFSAAGIQAAGKPGRTADDPGYGPFFSSCPFYGDWPLYWFPTGKLNGANTLPGTLTSTLQAPVGVPVVVPPFGESVVTGNAMATQTSPHVRFTCGGNTDGLGGGIDGPGSPIPTDCTGIPGGVVTGEITFPDCWDGAGVTRAPSGVLSFDAPYGISPAHFSYSPCAPGSVLIAQLVTQQTWLDNRPTSPDFNKPLRNPLNTDGTMALSFSSGSYATYHGDYIQTWNMSYLTAIVQQCLNHGTPGSCPFGTRVGLHNLE